MGNVLEARRSD